MPVMFVKKGRLFFTAGKTISFIANKVLPLPGIPVVNQQLSWHNPTYLGLGSVFTYVKLELNAQRTR